MASFSVGTGNQYVTCTVSAWEVSTNSSSNYSTVRVQVTYSRTGAYEAYNTAIYTHIWCDGQDGGTITRSLSMNSGNGYSTSFSQDFTVYHNSDGSKTLNFCYEASESGTRVDWTVSYRCGSLTLTQFQTATSPTISSIGVYSSTYNSIYGWCDMSSWGSGGSTSSRDAQILAGVTSNTQTSGVFGTWNRIMQSCGSSTYNNGTITNSSTQQGDGTFTLEGMVAYRLAGYATNGAADTRVYPGNQSVRYLPPAPLTSLTHSDTIGSSAISSVITVKGSYSNDYVYPSTQIRYSTDGGTTYTSWQTINSSNYAWTAVSTTLSLPVASDIYVQARQAYQGMYSNISTISWTTEGGDPPSLSSWSWGTLTYNSATVDIDGIDFGAPSSASGRYIDAGVMDSTQANWLTATKRSGRLSNASSGSITVNNSSTGTLQLKGLLPVRFGYNISNTAFSVDGIGSSIKVLPPAPITLETRTTSDKNLASAELTLVDSSNNIPNKNIWAVVEYNGTSTGNLSYKTGENLKVVISDLTYNTSYPVSAYLRAHSDTDPETGTGWSNSAAASITLLTLPRKPVATILALNQDSISIHYEAKIDGGAENLKLCAKLVSEDDSKTEIWEDFSENVEGERLIPNLVENQDYSLMIYLIQESTGQTSDFVNISFTPRAGFSNLYGSVNNKSVRINKLYASVNGKSTPLFKLYAGDDKNKARLLYEE
ncbi:MAG: hypothetical protein NC218_03855 [Acetobacter sp.]|nr:hypothetical protein [Acetobacter sp.]